MILKAVIHPQPKWNLSIFILKICHSWLFYDSLHRQFHRISSPLIAFSANRCLCGDRVSIVHWSTVPLAVGRKLTSCPSLFCGHVQAGCQGHSQRKANLEMQVENARSSEMRGEFWYWDMSQGEMILNREVWLRKMPISQSYRHDSFLRATGGIP